MTLPEDPFMLMSMINMKLRDGFYDSFSALCEDYGVNETTIVEKLKEHGFEYYPGLKQFR